FGRTTPSQEPKTREPKIDLEPIPVQSCNSLLSGLTHLCYIRNSRSAVQLGQAEDNDRPTAHSPNVFHDHRPPRVTETGRDSMIRVGLYNEDRDSHLLPLHGLSIDFQVSSSSTEAAFTHLL